MLPLALAAASASSGRKALPTAYAPASGSVEAGFGAQERVRDLEQDAGPVTGRRVGAGGAAVVEVRRASRPWATIVVARHAAQGRDESDSAGVVFVRRVVEALRLAGPW